MGQRLHVDPHGVLLRANQYKCRWRFVPLLLFLLATSACSILRRSDGPRLGNQDLLAGEATLVCSQECADRGLCGTAIDGEMVLLSSFGPATQGHDMAIRENTAVTIDHQEWQTAFTVSTNEPVQISYYLVLVPDRGPGWVAGWCIAQ